jgi:PPOX class probable F420-dependent enzyme
MNAQAQQFQNHDFINLETFYKSGKGVKTPVWFAQEEDILWVHTIAGSHKVQRVNATGRLNVAPCDRVGNVLGEWTPALGEEVTDEAVHERINGLLREKYGAQRDAFDAMAREQGTQSTLLRIHVLDQEAG